MTDGLTCQDWGAGLAGMAKTFFLPLVLTSLSPLSETPNGRNWQKLAKTQFTKTVVFLVTNCLKQKKMCVRMLLKHPLALFLIGFLAGDYLKVYL